MVETFDEVLLELGNPGKFRILLFVLLTCIFFPISFNSSTILLSAIMPKHRCKPPPNSTFSWEDYVPLAKDGTRSSCQMWVNPYNQSEGTTNCLYGIHYEVNQGEGYVVTEFDLVCDRAYIYSSGLSIAYAARVLGGLIYGYIADRFGRRKALISSMTINTVSSISAGFVQSPYLYYAVIFCLAFSIQSLHSSVSTSVSELFHPRQRTVTFIFMTFPWSIGLTMIAGLFWWLQYWRHVQMIIGFSTLIAFVYNWFLPESIQWHMARGEVDESMKICEKFSRFNGHRLPQGFKQDLERISCQMMESQTKSSKGSYKELFTSPDIAKYTFILGYGYFSALILYVTIIFALPKLGGNKFLSYTILGIVECIMRLIASQVFHRYGRRIPLIACTFLASVAIMLAALIAYWRTGESMEYASIALAIFGNFILILNFSGQNLMFTEVYPTLMRSIGVGFCMTLGRLGPILVPHLMLLGSTWEPLPVLIASVIGFISGCLSFMLPETNRKSLPVSTGEAKDLQKSSLAEITKL